MTVQAYDVGIHAHAGLAAQQPVGVAVGFQNIPPYYSAMAEASHHGLPNAEQIALNVTKAIAEQKRSRVASLSSDLSVPFTKEEFEYLRSNSRFLNDGKGNDIFRLEEDEGVSLLFRDANRNVLGSMCTQGMDLATKIETWSICKGTHTGHWCGACDSLSYEYRLLNTLDDARHPLNRSTIPNDRPPCPLYDAEYQHELILLQHLRLEKIANTLEYLVPSTESCSWEMYAKSVITTVPSYRCHGKQTCFTAAYQKIAV